nr:amino acid ABC transporter permease [Periweissella beninensis]
MPLTLELTIISFIGQLILGFILTLGQMSKERLIFRITRIYISFMRGTPILVILFLIYFGLPDANYQIPAFTAAAVAFILNGAAFVSEIFRSAFLGVDKGQYDAAKSLRMPYLKIIRYIIFPQAFRIAIPALGNVILDLFKGTSLAAVITVSEMFMHAKIVAGRNFDYMTIYIEIVLVYWACCSLITWGQSHLEKHLDYN